MAFPDKAGKKVSDHVPVLKDQGMEYLTGAGKSGVSIQCLRVTQVGATPFALNFVAQGLKNMADGLYDVIVQGPNGDERADYATRTPTGVNITGGANAEQHIVLIVGRIAGQASV